MARFHQFLSMLRGPRSSFGPGGPAPCDQPRRSTPTPAGAQPPSAGEQGAADRLPPPDEPRLRIEGEKILARSRALGQAPAMAVLQIDDLPELELVFGPAAVDAVLEAAQAGLARASGGLGLVVRTAVDTFALLMPGGGASTTMAAVRNSFGTPCTIDIGFGRDDLMVAPDVMVHPFARGDSVEQVYADLCRYIAKARRQRAEAARPPRRRLPPAPAPQARAPQYCPPVPATIPVPLSAH